MIARPLRPSDVQILDRRARESGFPYPAFDDPLLEATVVIADDDDLPITACSAKRLVELYLYPNPDAPPALMLNAIGFLHQAMANALRQKGYSEANIFLPPPVQHIFGRRLERSFGWAKNWVSWYRKF